MTIGATLQLPWFALVSHCNRRTNYGKMVGMSERQELNELVSQLDDAQVSRVRAFAETLLHANRQNDTVWSYDFAEKFSEAKVSAQRDRAGMEVKVGDATCDGVTKRALWEHPPLAGAAIVSYAVPIPRQLRDLKLYFSAGIRDGAQLPNDRFVAFRVVVNGWKLWSVVKNTRAWDEYIVAMPELGSDIARIEFQTDGLGDHRWNWAVWGEPKLIADL